MQALVDTTVDDELVPGAVVLLRTPRGELTSAAGTTERMMDVTEHPTGDSKIYLPVVLEAFSRMVVGWSILDHMSSR